MALQVLQDKEPKQVQSLSVHCVMLCSKCRRISGRFLLSAFAADFPAVISIRFMHDCLHSIEQACL
jgi:hypothetical protein